MKEGREVLPYGMREIDGKRVIAVQTRTWRGEHYQVALYFIDDDGSDRCAAEVIRTDYYAITTTHLLELNERDRIRRCSAPSTASSTNPCLIGTRPNA